MSDSPIEITRKLLIQNGKVYVNDLSRRFGVSKVSARKYLARLEDEGIAQRFYGGASLLKKEKPDQGDGGFYSDPLLLSLARTACGQIEDGDSLFIGSGRSCCVLARELKGIKNLTVVTNNITALTDLNRNATRVFLIGGELTTTDNSTLFSSWESHQLMPENIFVNKAFTSTSGLDLKAGITVDSIISTYIFKHIPEMAQQWYLMADSGKYDKISIYSVADFDSIDVLISDQVPQNYREHCRKHEVRIISPSRL